MKAIRKIKKSHISVTGYFSSYKNKRQINFESKLEHDFYLLLEFDRNVQSYHEQPFLVYYKYQGLTRRYPTDTLITYIDGSQKVFEVKPLSKIKNSIELQEKLNLQRQKIEEKNLNFFIFTDNDINTVYINNIKAIYNCAFLKENQEIQYKIKKELLNLNTSIAIKDLLDSLTINQTERLRFIPYLWNLVFKNFECIDLTKKVTMASMIDPKEIRWED